jgi:hypothetical protein
MTHAISLSRPLGRLASISLLAVAAGSAGAAVSNIDPEQQFAPDDLAFKAELMSKEVDQGRVRHDDATAHVTALGRTLFGLDTPGSRQGVGAQLDAYVAVGEDQTHVPATMPGEVVQFNGKLTYFYEALDEGDRPVIQLIPTYEYITYPKDAVRDNYLKFRQNWIGGDAWWCPWFLPEGIEVGGGTYWNMNKHARMFKAAAGAREFYQDAPFDLSGWQLLNFGNEEFKRYFAGPGLPPPDPSGVAHAGLTTLDLGGRITLPLPWDEQWTYVQADWQYWPNRKDRDLLHAQGRDVGDFIMVIGYEWRPE